MYKISNPDVLSTVEPLNHVLNIFGLSCVTRYEGTIQLSWYTWKVILILSILFFANACEIYLKIQYVLSPRVINFNNSIHLFYIFSYCQIIIDVYYVALYRNDCLEYYLLFDYIDTVLGLPDYSQIRKSIIGTCSFFIMIGTVTILFDYIVWIFSVGWIYASIYSIDYVYSGLRIMSALDTMSHYIQVLFRLKVIGNSLQGIYSGKDLKLGGAVSPKQKSTLDRLNIVCYNHCDVILWLRRCYLLLLEQCDFINAAYGFRILVSNSFFLLDTVMLLNLLIRQITGTVVTIYYSGYLPIVSTLLRIAFSISILLFSISRCEQNYRETERIISMIDDLIINRKTANEDRESLAEFKYLITTRPIKYTAMNFYRLDYACFVSVASVIITYTIILLQSMT